MWGWLWEEEVVADLRIIKTKRKIVEPLQNETCGHGDSDGIWRPVREIVKLRWIHLTSVELHISERAVGTRNNVLAFELM
jgi:hypothetical protein